MKGMNRRICLYGNSIILGTLGISLRSCPDYEVISLLPSMRETQELEALKPDFIFFDLEVTRPEAVLPLLGTLSGLVLLGVSPDKNLVKVWSGQQLRELSTQGLLEVIRDLKGSPVDPGAANIPVLPPHFTLLRDQE